MTTPRYGQHPAHQPPAEQWPARGAPGAPAGARERRVQTSAHPPGRTGMPLQDSLLGAQGGGLVRPVRYGGPVLTSGSSAS
ncbi:hypothetical protein QFZ82_007590 [Streptomyces sp. V4I23]|nr:hypothetical protein [Streptomyces sp. V4I23]